jgi:hypothetical protein
MDQFELQLEEQLAKAPARKKPSKRTCRRVRVAERYGWRCWWCSQRIRERMGWQNSATIEHLVPRSQGGSNEIWNLVAACHRCNLARGTEDSDGFAQRARGFAVDTRTDEDARRAAIKERRRRRAGILPPVPPAPPTLVDHLRGWYLRVVSLPWMSLVPA